MSSITLTQPDDWHVHLRSGDLLTTVAPLTARQFKRAMIMPNLAPPIVNAAQALAYRKKILDACPEQPGFEPLMSLYLTDNTDPDTVIEAAKHNEIVGFKLYPQGATTHSNHGVSHIDNIIPALEKIAETGLVLQVHGEVTDTDIDIFDREHVFIDRVLAPLMARIPELKIIFEHITTKPAVDFVLEGSNNIAATITPQHLMFNRNALFTGGIRPHYYCLPVLKRELHQEALRIAATSGQSKFFLGTDSAPHTESSKLSSCGCAGIFSAHAAIELYAIVFDEMNALDKLEGFASHFGADFYGRERSTETITLSKTPYQIEESIIIHNSQEKLIPLLAGETIAWQMQ